MGLGNWLRAAHSDYDQVGPTRWCGVHSCCDPMGPFYDQSEWASKSLFMSQICQILHRTEWTGPLDWFYFLIPLNLCEISNRQYHQRPMKKNSTFLLDQNQKMAQISLHLYSSQVRTEITNMSATHINYSTSIQWCTSLFRLERKKCM